MRAKVKVLMIAEMEVSGDDLEAAAQAKLDEFREAVLPEEIWGISLYRTSWEELEREELKLIVLEGK